MEGQKKKEPTAKRGPATADEPAPQFTPEAEATEVESKDEVERQIEAQRKAEEERNAKNEGKPTKYRVSGDQPVFGHEPGEEFTATLTPEQEERKLVSGALAKVGKD